jgi:hypothetical protein
MITIQNLLRDNDLFIAGGIQMGHAVAHLVQALSYKPQVAGSIPDRVTGIFSWHNSFGCTVALGSTQFLTEMSTRNISWG